MLTLIRRYGYRFLTSSAYRSYIFQLLRERSAPPASAEEFHLSANNDFSSLRGQRAFMCGGCELTFIGDHFTSVGLDVYHTFENGRASEPLIEVNDRNSALFTQSFDFVLFCQTQWYMQIVRSIFSEGAKYTEEQRQRDLQSLLDQLRQAIETANQHVDLPIFLVSHFFIHGKFRGVHDYKSAPGLTSYEEINLKYTAGLYEIAKSYNNVYVLDVNEILEVEGKQRSLMFEERAGIFDHPTKFGARLIAEETLYQLLVLNPKTKRAKCAVFDLDNTLWRGVLREDGVGNLYPIWSHLHVMHALAARGVLLAVCSKNDAEELPLVEQVLGKGLFDKLVSVKLNWNPKSQNVKQIARELNIGADSIVYFDDNPVEREEIKANVPGVLVLEETKITSALDMALFEPIGIVTEESATRTQMYKEQAKRAAAEAVVDPTDLASFFKSCAFKLDISRANADMTARIEELIQRTNQLNATGKRTTRDQLVRYLADPSQYHVSTASLNDKFGDYGLIGVCVAERTDATWEILEFDFSCRAMGKHVEHAMLAHLCQSIRNAGGRQIAIHFKKTSRNAEMRSILQSFGFNASQESDEMIQLDLPLNGQTFSYPEWFEITVREAG